MTAPNDRDRETVRSVVLKLCADSICTFIDERSCGCFQVIHAAIETARAEGAREQRTPGMIEKCPRCGGEWDDGSWSFCPEYAENEGHSDMCPVRQAISQSTTEDGTKS